MTNGTTLHVPVSITNQYVEVTGAAVSTNITIGWEMVDEMGPKDSTMPLLADYTTPTATVMTDTSGYYKKQVYNNTGNYSTTVDENTDNYIVKVRSVIKDANGNAQKTTSTTVNYSIMWAV